MTAKIHGDNACSTGCELWSRESVLGANVARAREHDHQWAAPAGVVVGDAATGEPELPCCHSCYGHATAAFTIETYQHVQPAMQADAGRETPGDVFIDRSLPESCGPPC